MHVHPFEVRHRDVWRIALPATLAFVTEPLAGLTDLTVIGRLGDASLLAGTVLGGLAATVIFSLFYFLRLGTAGLTAQAIGARDPDDGLIHLVRAGLLSVLLGGMVITLGQPIEAFLALVLQPPTNAGPHYATYFSVRLWSAPFVCLNYALLGWFYGRAAATTGMALQFIIHGINIVLSIWLVYGLGWGVYGVALATVLGQVAATLAGLYLVYRHFGSFSRLGSIASFKAIADAPALKRLFGLSRDLTIRTLVLNGVFVFFTAQTSRMGEVTLAANELLLYFLMVTAFFLDGQGQAAEQLCGKAVGARYRPAFAQAVRLSLMWGFGIGFCMFVFWMAAGPGLIDFMTTNAEIRQTARQNLFPAALAAFTGVLPFVMDGVTQGATLNRVIRDGMLASTAIYLVVALTLQSLYGLDGLWVALHVFFVARGIIFAIAVQKSLPALFPRSV